MANPTFLAWLKGEIGRWWALPAVAGRPLCNLAFSGMTGGEEGLGMHAEFASLGQAAGRGWREDVSQDGGHRRLRERVAQIYGAESAENVLIVSGATQANFLVMSALRRLCGPGARALVESPGYGPLFEVPRYLGLEVVGMPRVMAEGFGVRPPGFQAARDGVAVVSNPHNPSGVLVGAEQIGALAGSCGCAAVVVDETFLTPGDGGMSAVRLGDERIIVMGSLSKTVGLGFLRAGWIIARGAMLERLRELWIVGFNIGCKLTEGVGAEVLGNLEAHEGPARELARNNLELVAGTLDELQGRGLLRWKNPGQGSIAFPQLTVGGKGAVWEFYRRALERQRLAVIPGHWFDPTDPDRSSLEAAVDQEAHHHIRIGFGGATEQVRLGLGRLREAVEGMG